MPGSLEFGRFAPSALVPEGRLFRESGELTATVSSHVSGDHLTVRLRCVGVDDLPARWPEATRTVIEDFDGELIGVYEHGPETLTWGPRASSATRWAVAALLRYLAGADRRLVEQADLAAV